MNRRRFDVSSRGKIPREGGCKVFGRLPRPFEEKQLPVRVTVACIHQVARSPIIVFGDATARRIS
jgi:hypothetical protein